MHPRPVTTRSTAPNRRARLAGIALITGIVATACIPGSPETAPAPTPPEIQVAEPSATATPTPPEIQVAEPSATATPTPTTSAPSESQAPERPSPEPETPAAPPAVEPTRSDIDVAVDRAVASPLFVAQLTTADLSSEGLTSVQLARGVELDTEAFVAATSLDATGEFRALFDPDTVPYLTGTATYAEPVVALRDRLLVDRRLDFQLEPGACASQAGHEVLAELCIVIDPDAPVPPEVAADLADARRRLAAQPSTTDAGGGRTAGDLLAMSDADLLDTILNQGERSIRRLSIVPTGVSDTTAPGGSIRDFDSGAIAHLTDDDVVPLPTGPRFPQRPPLWTGPPRAFDTEYFLTGFTLGKRVADTWEYTLAEASWWHDRYFVKFEYDLSFGFGVRAPFSVDVAYDSGTSDRSTIAIEVAPTDVDENGAPAYPAVGLPQNKYFDGNEFVLEAAVECSLTISIPGPDPDTRTCSGLGIPKIDESRDLDPVIGDESTAIKDWWIPGSRTGLGIDVGVAEVSLDIGAGLDITNGRIGVRVEPHGNTALSGTSGDMLWFDDRNPTTLSLERRGQGDLGFTTSDPHYAFDLRLRPKVRLNAEVDLSIYRNDWQWTLPLDFLSISAGFQLDHHDGTVAEHEYALEWAPLVVAEVATAPQAAATN